MKIVTLHQPWALLYAKGDKQNETRGWATSHRGELGVHAAAQWPAYAREWAAANADLLVVLLGPDWEAQIRATMGCVLGSTQLVDVVPTDHTGELPGWLDATDHRGRDVWVSNLEARLGDYSRGRYAWLSRGATLLEVPVPARGFQRLWEWTL